MPTARAGVRVRQPNTTTQRASTSNATECRHSREPFDANFAVIAERTDIGPGAKLLYAKLVTMHRTGNAWTQDEIGTKLGTCRQNVWRWAGELVTAGLLRVTRTGQGRPNGYTLLGVSQEDLDGNAPKLGATGAGHQEDRRPVQDWPAPFKVKKNGKERGYPGVRMSGFLETREGHYYDVIGRQS